MASSLCPGQRGKPERAEVGTPALPVPVPLAFPLQGPRPQARKVGVQTREGAQGAEPRRLLQEVQGQRPREESTQMRGFMSLNAVRERKSHDV